MKLHNHNLYLVLKCLPHPGEGADPLPLSSLSRASSQPPTDSLPLPDISYKQNPTPCGPLSLASFTQCSVFTVQSSHRTERPHCFATCPGRTPACWSYLRQRPPGTASPQQSLWLGRSHWAAGETSRVTERVRTRARALAARSSGEAPSAPPTPHKTKSPERFYCPQSLPPASSFLRSPQCSFPRRESLFSAYFPQFQREGHSYLSLRVNRPASVHTHAMCARTCMCAHALAWIYAPVCIHVHGVNSSAYMLAHIGVVVLICVVHIRAWVHAQCALLIYTQVCTCAHTQTQWGLPADSIPPPPCPEVGVTIILVFQEASPGPPGWPAAGSPGPLRCQQVALLPPPLAAPALPSAGFGGAGASDTVAPLGTR